MMKFDSRFPLWVLTITVLACIGNIYYAFGKADGSAPLIISLVANTVGAAVFTNALYNRLRRPSIEIRDDAIVCGSVFQLVRRHTKLADIAEILPDSSRKVALRMRTGRTRNISLWEVARSEREAARQAIVEAIETRSP